MEPTTRYTAVCLQTNINVVDETNPDPGHAEEQIRKNLARQTELIDWLYLDQRTGGPKLITFSEFSLTGTPETRSIDAYRRSTVYLPGWVTEVLGEKAKQYDCYIASNTYERDDEFPGMLFNTSFIVGPDGNVALKYRKNNASQGGQTKATNPGDIYDYYVAKTGGPEALFPVIDTPIGRLACITCFDIRYPEIVRCLAMRGAEVIVHPTAEPQRTTDAPWTLAKGIRAWDNQVYLLSCNNGETFNSKRPINRQWGGSRILNWDGKTLAEAVSPGETVIQAEIDLEALRRHRAGATRNMLATSRFFLYAPSFADPNKQTWPLNSFTVDEPYETGAQMREIGGATIQKMVERRQIIPPDEDMCSNGKPYVKQYQVACLQTDVHALDIDEFTPKMVEEHTRTALTRNSRLIDWLCNEPRHGPKLLCLSEFHLTGVPESRLMSDYTNLAVEVPGWVTEVYGAKAKEYGVHIAGGVFEKDPQWPDRIFNTAFLIGPDGNVILRYRKNNDCQTGITPTTNPGDLYDAYTDAYGDDPFYPVVDTELGQIGLMVCYDIRFAEVPRMLALNGAEVILHPTAEGQGADTWQIAKRVRAWDNACYLVSTNNGETFGSTRPRFKQRAYSTQVVDYQGERLIECNATGESVITAEIDLEALRRFRSSTARNNIATSRFATYAPLYRDFEGWPKNAFLDHVIEDNKQAPVVARKALEKLYEDGVLIAPRGSRAK